MDINIGIADMKVTDDSTATLVTHSLGSCIGVAVYDPVVNVGGLLHFMLPQPTNAEKAEENPCMFCETGVPRLFKECYKLGAKKGRMVVKIAGGSQVLKASETFSIGQRNYGAIRKILFRNNVLVKAEDIGGSRARTMRLEIATGKVTSKSPNCDLVVL